MFLEVAELVTHLPSEIVNSISDSDDSIPQAAIDAAIAEAQSYLVRFNTSLLFAAQGTARDAALLMFVKDIAVWHFLNLGNPGTDYESRYDRYKFALNWLKGIQDLKIPQPNWPLPQPPDTTNYFVSGGNPRRGSHI